MCEKVKRIQQINVLYVECAKDIVVKDIYKLITDIKPSGSAIEQRDIKRLQKIVQQMNDLEILTDGNYGV